MRKIEAKRQHKTASRLKQSITVIMRYAVQEEMIEHNPVDQLDETITLPKRKHYPAIKLHQIPD